jgi:hypothetical protein
MAGNVYSVFLSKINQSIKVKKTLVSNYNEWLDVESKTTEQKNLLAFSNLTQIPQ